MVKIKVYSDYVCPFCYFGEQILKELQEEEGDFSVEWMPFELRPYPTPTLKPEDEYLPRIWKSSVYPMAENLGLDVKLPTVSPQPYTHLAFEGYQFAKERGKGEEYSNRMFEAFFRENKDIGEIDVLAELAREIRLDPVTYRQALESRQYREQHLQALQEAQEYGIRAVPTFQIGQRLYQGVIPKEQLREIIRETEVKNNNT
jgi:predicted DsbA family dithiol-disulfide isomerase